MKTRFKRSLATLLSVLMVLSAVPIMGFAEASAEMLLDPGMEQIAVGWEDRHAGTGDAISYSTDVKHSGEKSIKAKNGSEFQTTRFEFDASKGYKFSIWVKGSGRYWISVPCYDENGTPLATYANWADVNRGSSYIESGNIDHNDWVQQSLGISAGGIVPSETKYFRVHIRTLAKSGESSAEFYFDDASLTASDSTTDTVKYDGLINPDPGMNSVHWWTLTKSAQDYTTYHSAPASIKAQYDSTVFEIAKEKQNAYNFDANKHYELSVWAKTDNCTDAELRLFMNTQWSFKNIVTFNPTTEWKQYKGYFKGSDVANASGSMGNSRKVGVQARDGGALGNIWIDDITFREVIIPGSITLSGEENVNLPDFNSKNITYTATVKDVNNADMTNVELKWEVESDYPEDITISESGILTVSDKVLPGKAAVIKVSSREFPEVKAEKTISFTYTVTESFKSQFQSLLTTGADADAVAFLSSPANNKPLAELGVKLEDFNSDMLDDTDRAAVVAAVKASATEVLEDNIVLLNNTIFFRLVNSAEAAAVEEILLAYDEEQALGLASNEIYIELCKEENAVVKQAAFAKIAEKTYTDSSTLKTDIDEKLAVSYISFATTGQIEDALALVAVKAGLSTNSKYNSYTGLSDTSSKKIAINKAMVAEYDTYTEIYNAFISAYDNAPSDITGGGGGGSTGGGGGSGSGSGNKGSSTIVVPYEPIIAEPSVQITPNEQPAQEEKFSDMKTVEWAQEAVAALSDEDIINGYTNGTFKPDNAVTREEFLKMLLGAVELVKDDVECSFEDVSKDEWYHKYIATAADLGIAQGISKTAFGVGQSITREQMATFAMRAILAAELAEEQTADDESFGDDAEISEYAKTAVYQMKKLGIISGFPDGSFKPQNGATRAEAAVVIYAIFNLK